MQDHRRLHVYQTACELALQVYLVAAALPGFERYDLARQLRRAGISVGSNIAEGSGRGTARDFCAYLSGSLGSARELEFQLDHCIRAKLAPESLVQPALETAKRVQPMLTRLILRIRSRDG
jgi:four helix bundle protein